MVKKIITVILVTFMFAASFSAVSASADFGQMADGIVTGDVVNIREGQGTNTAIITQVKEGTRLCVYGLYDGWAYVCANQKMGYISLDYFQVIDKNSATSASDKGQAVCDYAKQFLGLPYRYGGNSPSTGFDCSGFTKYVFAQFGVTLDRVAAAQATNGVYVSKDQLQPGDLVCFGYYGSSSVGHVGIYVGNGQFIHSPSTGKSIMYSDLNSSYYAANYITARRVL